MVNAIARKDNPCQKCEDRTQGCHSTCERHKEFRKRVDEFNKEKQKFRERRGFIPWY